MYTGEGKGKSTSALGKALQAIGRGISQDKSHRVLILQWLKGGSGYTEDAAIAALRESYPHLVDHLRSGRDAIVWRGQQQPIDYVEAERAWEIARAAISSGLYKTVILDEINPTVDLELLPVEPIVQTLLRKPAETEVILDMIEVRLLMTALVESLKASMGISPQGYFGQFNSRAIPLIRELRAIGRDGLHAPAEVRRGIDGSVGGHVGGEIDAAEAEDVLTQGLLRSNREGMLFNERGAARLALRSHVRACVGRLRAALRAARKRRARE